MQAAKNHGRRAEHGRSNPGPEFRFQLPATGRIPAIDIRIQVTRTVVRDVHSGVDRVDIRNMTVAVRGTAQNMRALRRQRVGEKIRAGMQELRSLQASDSEHIKQLPCQRQISL